MTRPLQLSTTNSEDEDNRKSLTTPIESPTIPTGPRFARLRRAASLKERLIKPPRDFEPDIYRPNYRSRSPPLDPAENDRYDMDSRDSRRGSGPPKSSRSENLNSSSSTNYRKAEAGRHPKLDSAMSPPRRGSITSKEERNRDDRRSDRRLSDVTKATSVTRISLKAQGSPKELPIETATALADLFLKVADSTSTISYLKNQKYLAMQETHLRKTDPTMINEESDERFPSVKEFYQGNTEQAERRLADISKQFESSNKELRGIFTTDTPQLFSSIMQSASAGGGNANVQSRLDALEKLFQEKDKIHENKLKEQQETINRAMALITRLEQDKKEFARATTAALKNSIEQDMLKAKENAAGFERLTMSKLQELSNQTRVSKFIQDSTTGQIDTLQQQIKVLQGVSSRVEQSQAKLEATMSDSIKQISERATKASSDVETLLASTTTAARDAQDLKLSLETIKVEAAAKASQLADLKPELIKLDARLQEVESSKQNDNVTNLIEDLETLKGIAKKAVDRVPDADASGTNKSTSTPGTSSDSSLLQIEDRIMKKVGILQASVNDVTDIIGSTVEDLVADAIKGQSSRLSIVEANFATLSNNADTLRQDLNQLHDASGSRFHSLEPKLAEIQHGVQQIQQAQSTFQDLEAWMPFLVKLKSQWIPAHEVALTQLRDRADNIMSADVVQAMLDCLSQNHPGLDIKGQWLKNLDEHHKALVDQVWKLDAKIRKLESAFGQSEVTIQIQTDRIRQLEPNVAKDKGNETLVSLQSMKHEAETQFATLTQKLLDFEEAIGSIKQQQEKRPSDDLKKILQQELETISAQQSSSLSTTQQTIDKAVAEMTKEFKIDIEKKASKEEFDALKKQVNDNEQLASDYVADSRRIAEKVEEKLVTEVEKLGKKIETEIQAVEGKIGVKLGEVESRAVELGEVEERVETKLRKVEERLSKTFATTTTKQLPPTSSASANRPQSPSRSSTSSSRSIAPPFGIKAVANTTNGKNANSGTAFVKSIPKSSNNSTLKRRHMNGTPDRINGHLKGNTRGGPPNKKARKANDEDEEEDIRPQLSDDADDSKAAVFAKVEKMNAPVSMTGRIGSESSKAENTIDLVSDSD